MLLNTVLCYNSKTIVLLYYFENYCNYFIKIQYKINHRHNVQKIRYSCWCRPGTRWRYCCKCNGCMSGCYCSCFPKNSKRKHRCQNSSNQDGGIRCRTRREHHWSQWSCWWTWHHQPHKNESYYSPISMIMLMIWQYMSYDCRIRLRFDYWHSLSTASTPHRLAYATPWDKCPELHWD